MTVTSRMLAGRYRLLNVVGHGGMAVVHRGHDDVLDRDVAIKLLRPGYANDEEFVARFRREARHAASLHHPNIVAIYDRGIDPETGTDYIVMQLIDGPDLDMLLAAEGRLPLGQALRMGVETTRALQAAHDRGIVHRDVKPGNILIDRDGTARVADFGIARAVSESSATTTGVILASPQYASPEQVLGERVMPASDIYSLGVVLYDAITGQRPFDGPSPAAVALERLRVRPAPPSAVVHDLPPAVDRVILRSLEREPRDRYPSAAEMGAELEDIRLRELGGIRRSGARVRGLIGDVGVVAAAAGAATTAGSAAATGSLPRPVASGPRIATDDRQPAADRQPRTVDTVAIAIPATEVAAASVAGAVADGPMVPPTGAAPVAERGPSATATAAEGTKGLSPVDRGGVVMATDVVAPAANPALPVDSARAIRDRRRRRSAPIAMLALSLAGLAAVVLGIGLLNGFAERTGPSSALPSDDPTAIGVATPTPTPIPSPTPTPTPTAFVAALPPTPEATASPTRTATPAPPPTPKPTAAATPRPAPRPAPRPTPTPAPPGAAPTTPSRDPAETVTRFYDLVEQHRFTEAARLWSARMRRQNPPSEYINDRFASTTRIDLDHLRIRSMNVEERTANVVVDLTEYRTSGAPRHWVGDWDLVLTSAGWLMDRPHF